MHIYFYPNVYKYGIGKVNYGISISTEFIQHNAYQQLCAKKTINKNLLHTKDLYKMPALTIIRESVATLMRQAKQVIFEADKIQVLVKNLATTRVL